MAAVDLAQDHSSVTVNVGPDLQDGRVSVSSGQRHQVRSKRISRGRL
jgi:hypothetical protein